MHRWFVVTGSLYTDNHLYHYQPIVCVTYTQVPDILREYVIQGALPSANELQAAAAAVPQLQMSFALKQLKEAAAAAAAAVLPGAADSAESPAAAAVALELRMP